MGPFWPTIACIRGVEPSSLLACGSAVSSNKTRATRIARRFRAVMCRAVSLVLALVPLTRAPSSTSPRATCGACRIPGRIATMCNKVSWPIKAVGDPPWATSWSSTPRGAPTCSATRRGVTPRRLAKSQVALLCSRRCKHGPELRHRSAAITGRSPLLFLAFASAFRCNKVDTSASLPRRAAAKRGLMPLPPRRFGVAPALSKTSTTAACDCSTAKNNKVLPVIKCTVSGLTPSSTARLTSSSSPRRT
mmetsp:Transcript_5226/g.11630  ORF Transcript_5226/g.11630 Transcript_5226/m.11630 type:complete len:248 (-) Transcript_5226:177-920(-)